MGDDARVPPGLFERIRQMIRDEVGKLLRSGLMRNASLSDGRFTIKGGALVVEAADGSTAAYFGGILPAMPDGNVQPGFILYREDGSIAAALYDPTPDPSTPDGFKQFFAIYDRAGNIVFSDDTDSGQGHARPWLSGGFTAKRFTDFRYSTTSPTWETLCDQLVTKQQPRLQVGLRASMDTAGTTGEVRVLVNGDPLGSVAAEGFAVSTRYFGAEAVAGDYGDDLLVEIQGRRTSASGTLRVEPRFWKGCQS